MARELKLGGNVKATIDPQGIWLQQHNRKIRLPLEEFVVLIGLWGNQHFSRTLRPQEVTLPSARIRWDAERVVFSANGLELALTSGQMSRLLFAHLMGDGSINDPSLRGTRRTTE